MHIQADTAHKELIWRRNLNPKRTCQSTLPVTISTLRWRRLAIRNRQPATHLRLCIQWEKERTVTHASPELCPRHSENWR